jgi:hypothetical protein
MRYCDINDQWKNAKDTVLTSRIPNEPVTGRLNAQTRLFARATFRNALVKERFGLFSHALQLLFELPKFVTRKPGKHFLHRFDVRAENGRDHGFSARRPRAKMSIDHANHGKTMT